MPWIMEASELAKLIQIENVAAAQLDVGDILIHTTPLLISEIEHTDEGKTLIHAEGGGLIDTPSSTILSRVHRSCLREPPIAPTWSTFADKIESAKAMQTRVDLARQADPRGWSVWDKLTQKQEGFCERCCLPLGPKHAPHEPPGMSRPNGNDPRSWQPYVRAQVELYAAALTSLTNAEIMAMPIPTRPRHLRTILEELITRERNQPPPRTRYQRLRDETTK